MAAKNMHDNNYPMRSEFISWVEFQDATGCHPSRLGELIEMGWLEPRAADTKAADANEEVYLFRVSDIYRVRKLERLCQDFDLTCVGASIIVDLLLRIDGLQQQVRELQALCRR